MQSGNGYSTSEACHKDVCIGGNCPKPGVFDISPIVNSSCTTATDLEYSIGCGTGGENPEVCKQRFEDLFRGSSATTKTTTIKGTVGGVPNQDITVTCHRTSISDARYEQISCSVRLDSGVEVNIATGDYGGSNYQAISNIAARDTAAPTGIFVAQSEYTSPNNKEFSSNKWLNHEVTASIICTNDPQNSDACTCKDVYDLNTNDTDSNWQTNGNPEDSMTFTRTFREGKHTQTLKTTDNAGNRSTPMTVSLGIDMTPPTKAITTEMREDLYFHTYKTYVTVTATDTVS